MELVRWQNKPERCEGSCRGQGKVLIPGPAHPFHHERWCWCALPGGQRENLECERITVKQGVPDQPRGRKEKSHRQHHAQTLRGLSQRHLPPANRNQIRHHNGRQKLQHRELGQQSQSQN